MRRRAAIWLAIAIGIMTILLALVFAFAQQGW